MAAQEAAGWKLDYSPDCCGQYITGIRWYASLDRVFGARPDKHFTLFLLYPKNVSDAYRLLTATFGLPAAELITSGAINGNSAVVRLIGKADHVRIQYANGSTEIVSVDKNEILQLHLKHKGIAKVIPCIGAQEGFESNVAALESLDLLFHKNCMSLKPPYHIDPGLCEGGTWAWAACLHQRLIGRDPFIQKQLDAHRHAVMPEANEAYIPRCSIIREAENGWPAYQVYKSLRIQEAFFGIEYLLELYRTDQDYKALDYAIGTMDTILQFYTLDNGCFVRFDAVGGSIYKDYSSVTAPMIAVVDLCIILREHGDSRWEKYARAAEKDAEYLYSRGVRFPTEGVTSENYEEEMEEGSISCTALSLIYYCFYLKRNEKYLSFAKKLLDLHETWVMHSPDVRMFHSTMRWWETLWEGDKDGPSICAGHAWSIWRAEADFYYAMLTHSPTHFLSSYNGFLCNLVKIQENGDSYACWCPDIIPGGGFARGALKKKEAYPEKTDQSLSKYVWVRLEHTWRKTCVILPIGNDTIALNGEILSNEKQKIRIKTSASNVINLTAKSVCTGYKNICELKENT